MLKKFFKWLFIILGLIVMTSYFSYRLTLDSMGVTTDSGSTNGEKQLPAQDKEKIINIFKKTVDYNSLPIPEHDKLKKIQHGIFSSTPQIRSIRNSISILHQELDYKLRPEALVVMQMDSASIEWEGFVGSSAGVGNDTAAMVTRIDNMVSKISDQTLANDLRKAQNLLITGTEKKDLQMLWQAHGIIHDLDYFLLNYPVTVKTGIGSIENSVNGPKHYWGATEILK